MKKLIFQEVISAIKLQKKKEEFMTGKTVQEARLK